MGTIFISGFPGVGKTEFTYGDYAPEYFAKDSDSSGFSKAGFPSNYLDHLEGLRGKYVYVFISTHKLVRDGLVKRKIPFVLVYPDMSLKEEYLDRYKKRGSNEAFVTLLSQNWEAWITELSNQTDCTHIVLKSGQYLSNVYLPR